MNYKFTGQCTATIAEGYTEPLPNATVRLYHYRGTKYVTSLAVPELTETIRELTEQDLAAKQVAFIAESTIDAEGNFEISLGAEEDYNGEAIEVHLVVDEIPNRNSRDPYIPQEIHLTTMKPRWETSTTNGPEASSEQSVQCATWTCIIPAKFWLAFRQKYDAWVIVGQVVDQSNQQPLENVRVTAFDADRWQHDNLGAATTNRFGQFRIDFRTEQFTKTPLSPIRNAEEGGPDLFFLVERAEGQTLLEEPPARGESEGRKDAGACYSVELAVEAENVAVAQS